MRKGLIALAIIVPWVLLGVTVWDRLRRMDFFAVDAGTDAHALARQTFFAELAFEGCVPRAAVIALVEAHGWGATPVDGPALDDNPALAGWLQIQIEPPLPFSSDLENAAFVGFGADGCMAR